MHEPWALAIAGRIHALWGADASVVASDDGIVARIPDTDGKLPDAAIFLFEPEKLLQIVREAVGSSALFAARFRECAARALLMPGRTPGHRTALATTTARQSVAGNRSGISGFSGHSRNPTRMSARCL